MIVNTFIFIFYLDPCPYKEELGEFCGTSTPSYTARGSMYVLIRFSSDKNQEFRGFKAEYFLGEAKGTQHILVF